MKSRLKSYKEFIKREEKNRFEDKEIENKNLFVV